MSSTSSISSIEEFLSRECGVCPHCAALIAANDDIIVGANSNDDGIQPPKKDSHCSVCFGLMTPSYRKNSIMPKIMDSLRPYCRPRSLSKNSSEHSRDDGNLDQELNSPVTINPKDGNYLTKDSPTVNIPWLIAVRAQAAIAASQCFLRDKTNDNSTSSLSLRSAEEVYNQIKGSVRSSIRSALDSLSNMDQDGVTNDGDQDIDEYGVRLSSTLIEEECGFLGIHLLFLPPSLAEMKSNFNNVENSNDEIALLVIPKTLQSLLQRNKQQLHQIHSRALNPRKRFRGNDPTLKQGGDPRCNLEFRVRSMFADQLKKFDESNTNQNETDRNHSEVKRFKLADLRNNCSEAIVGGNSKEVARNTVELNTWSTIISWLQRSTVSEWLAEEVSNGDPTQLATWFRTLNESKAVSLCSTHAATWRLPFCIRGTYTKSRRDVSQTPFFVPSNQEDHLSQKMVRKGISSIEEEICTPLSLLGCGGISNQNNENVWSTAFGEGGDKAGATVYGMCKFHASGREDMDVRMLLPPPSVVKLAEKTNIKITARPFVCEVFDAHRLPCKIDLDRVVKAVNCSDSIDDKTPPTKVNGKDLEKDKNGWPRTLAEPNQNYGRNPIGVGVSYPLGIVPSSSFSGLQSETEEKVKFYACVCWTDVFIASDDELIGKLGCAKLGSEEDINNQSPPYKYPLEIHQSTPLRVLHRRSSDVRSRFIMGLSAKRIDDHWFRLRLSTSAGTYVKEFVHGDCGRTLPSIQSMLGGRTDITELDCEGMAI